MSKHPARAGRAAQTATILFLAALSTPLTGCLFSGLTSKESSVTESVLDQGSAAGNSTGGAGDACGLRAFRQAVHPQLRNNCGSCHGGAGPGPGSFAAYAFADAYRSAIGRANLKNPGGSALVVRSSESGHGGNCAVCSSAWGQTLTAVLREWAKAEANDPATCALYATTQTVETGSGGGVLTLGPYTPPRPEDTVIVPEGLAVFSGANGVHSLLKRECAQCHVQGARATFALLAAADATTSYRDAKPRTDFGTIESSMILTRASTVGHGDGCVICGDPTFMADLKNQITAWAAQEGQAAENGRVRLISKPFQPLPGGTTDKVITWNLATDTVPAQPAMAGATFSIRLRLATGSTTTYRVTQPTISTPNGVAIEVQELSFIVKDFADSGKDKLNATVTTFMTIDTKVPSGQGAGMSLSNSIALLPAINPANDQIGITFLVLKAH